MTLTNNVWETSTTTGTGVFNLAGAKDSTWQTFVIGLTADIGVQSPNEWTEVYYVIYTTDSDGDVDAVEVGKGTISAGSPATLTRADSDITYSTTSNNRVDWAAGEKQVICSMNAESFEQF